jgi:hypothetical protein
VDAKEPGAQGESAREKKLMKSKVPNQRSTRGFKGDMPDSPPLAPGSPCQQDFRPRAPRRNNRPQPQCLGSRGVQTCRACARS